MSVETLDPVFAMRCGGRCSPILCRGWRPALFELQPPHTDEGSHRQPNPQFDIA